MDDDIYDFIDPDTGDKVTFSWNKPTPPTEQDIRDQFALKRQASKPAPFKQAVTSGWDAANQPWGPFANDTINTAMDAMGAMPGPGNPARGYELAKTLIGSPMDAFTTIASAGAGTLENLGLKTGSKLLHSATRAANAGMTAKNLYSAGENIKEDNWGQAGLDLAFAGMSGMGIAGKKSGPSRIATEENPLKYDPFEDKIAITDATKLPASMKGVKGVKEINPTTLPLQSIAGSDFEDTFRNFTNGRESAKVRANAARRAFSSMDDLGVDAFKLAQANPKAPELKGVRQALDQAFADAKAAGVPVKWVENYLPQMWDKPMGGTAGAKVSTKPGFAMKRVFSSYQEGIDAGLTPKYDKMSDLIGDYTHRVYTAIENFKLLNDLKDQGLIKTVASKGQLPAGWKILDPNSFPISRNPKTGAVRNFAAPENVADQLDTYLDSFTPQKGKLGAVANFASASKELALSSGVPKTGLNAHGFNIVARSALAPTNNPLGEALNTAKWLVNPDGADEFFQSNQKGAVFAARAGVTGLAKHPGDYDRPVIDGLLGKVKDVHSKLFEEPLFEHVMPAVKLRVFNTVYQDMAGKVDPSDSKAIQQAMRQAADITNNMFGGIDWRTLGESKQFQSALRATVLAPDWLRSNINLAKQVPSGVLDAMMDPKNPVSQQYRKTARNMMVGYMAANIINYGSTGHFMFQNDPGHEFDVEIGSTNADAGGKAKKRYLRPFGTAADFVRVPLTAATSIARGDPGKIVGMARSRASMPGQALMDTMFGDWRGDKIWENKWGESKDAYGMASKAGEIGSRLISPPYATAGFDALTGSASPEEAFSRGAEMPLGFAAPFVPRDQARSKKKGLGHLGR